MSRETNACTGQAADAVSGTHPRILVIRRDNIGDLVCTTPFLFALRERFPHAHIAALVNTYNEAVLAGNPAVDAVYAYEKGKHRGEKRSIISVYAGRLKLMMSLRRENFDYAILATPGFEPRSLRLARIVGARHVLGYTEPGKAHPSLDIALTYDRSRNRHQVEDVFSLLRALGWTARRRRHAFSPTPRIAAREPRSCRPDGRGSACGIRAPVAPLALPHAFS